MDSYQKGRGGFTMSLLRSFFVQRHQPAALPCGRRFGLFVRVAGLFVSPGLSLAVSKMLRQKEALLSEAKMEEGKDPLTATQGGGSLNEPLPLPHAPGMKTGERKGYLVTSFLLHEGRRRAELWRRTGNRLDSICRQAKTLFHSVAARCAVWVARTCLLC